MKKYISITILSILSIIFMLSLIIFTIYKKNNLYNNIVMNPNQQFEYTFSVEKEPEKKLEWQFEKLEDGDIQLAIYQDDVCINETDKVESVMNLNIDNYDIKIVVTYTGAETKNVKYKLIYEYLGGGVTTTKAIKSLKLISK